MKKRIFFAAVILGMISGFAPLLHAATAFEHERLRRVTVFPIKADKDVQKLVDDLWWDLREKLTESKRFLVASKNFMQAKDVFQSRGELQPADALILGRLLDADALVTTFVVDRRFSMRVYETKNGLTLWAGDVNLHPALPMSKQLTDAAKKLLYDFLSSIPYQGHVVVDELIGRPAYADADRLLFKADVGVGTQVTVGDSVQLIRIRADKLQPLFQGGSALEVNAEGTVVAVDRQTITVHVLRRQEGHEIAADALVRIPDELRRLREMYGMHESAEKNISFEDFKKDDERLTQKEQEKKPLVVALSWIGNMALLLLLAL